MTQQINAAQLAECIQACFFYGMDGRVPLETRGEFIAHGKRLRGQFVNLVSAWFDERTAEFQNAVMQLQTVNSVLLSEAQVLSNIADAIQQIAALVAILDVLLNMVVAVV